MADPNPENNIGNLGRVDFEIEILHTNDLARTATFCLIPDPRRYTKSVIDGAPHYIDRYLRTAISEDDMLKMCAERAKGLPLYHLSASIKSTPAYAASRKTAIESELRGGGYVPPKEKAIAHRPLNTSKAEQRLVFLSVDICGSTALRHADRPGFDLAYGLFIRELGTVVGQFNGTLLKVTGDGFIAYIDHPAFTQQCDHAIDMGLSFLLVLQESINPALERAGIPPLRIRVGADYGDAVVRQVEISSTGFTTLDVVSDALNRAVKIEQSATENEFRIGRRLYELIHVQWLERALDVPFDAISIGMPGYKVYKVN